MHYFADWRISSTVARNLTPSVRMCVELFAVKSSPTEHIYNNFEWEYRVEKSCGYVGKALCACALSLCFHSFSPPLLYFMPYTAYIRSRSWERREVNDQLIAEGWNVKCRQCVMCDLLLFWCIKRDFVLDDGGLNVVVTLESCSSYLRFYRLCGWQPVHLQVSWQEMSLERVE